jgi:KUP system potassium uptake protein
MSSAATGQFASASHESSHRGIVIAALGVVFGDIGTSPTYALRECFNPIHGLALTPANIIGLLSLIIWSLVLIISVKYVGIIMKSDNRGEGGVLALSALLLAATRNYRFWGPVGAIGLFGAALFFGDGFITPPVSILGALEGLGVGEADPNSPLKRMIVPAAVAILVALFMVQKRGTGAMGKAFGPVMLVWFSSISLIAIPWIVQSPQVLLAVNPVEAALFFARNGITGFLVLSSVFLAVTGGEALYADMGHFGRAPIRDAWFWIVFPALLINYFGQGAILLQNPAAIESPFYMLAPGWLKAPLILIATAAAVIASQAVISGVFSVARQALNLGYLPRIRILHSSEDEIGQVYVPAVNWMLFVGTVLLVVGFRSSSALTGAYGIAVASTMLLDGVLVMVLLRFTRSRHHVAKIAVLSLVAILDVLFVASNSLKFPDGGWLPITVAIVVFILMTTWSEGRRTLAWLVARDQVPIREFLTQIEEKPPQRVSGTAVYLVNDPSGVPRALTQNLRFNHVLHERIVLLTFLRPEIPNVAPEDRVTTEKVAPGIERVIARYGFMETPNVIASLRAADDKGVQYKPEETVFVVGRDNPIVTRSSGMPLWRKRLFALMGRNSQLAAVHFGTPPHKTMEISSQVKF